MKWLPVREGFEWRVGTGDETFLRLRVNGRSRPGINTGSDWGSDFNSMRNREQFYNASQFLGCYFHLDWHEDFNQPEDAVAQFIKDADAQTRGDTLHELRQIIAEFPGPQLNKVLIEICCCYSPERHRGVPMREWLDQVIAELERSLSN